MAAVDPPARSVGLPDRAAYQGLAIDPHRPGTQVDAVEFDDAWTDLVALMKVGVSRGKIITVLSLAGGVVGLASGRFSMAQIAIPVGVGVGAGTGIPIVTSTVTATI